MNGLQAPHARISQNLAALVDSRRIVLMIVGEDKWAVYQRAKQAGSATELPVRAILHQQSTPIDIYWAP
jgi:6-phosphogluconolactonase